MSLAKQVHFITPADYYGLERTAETKSEYYQGEIFAMVGSSTCHSLIGANLTGELRQLFKGKSCAAYTSDQRIKVLATGLRAYPDASVFCDPIQYDNEDRESETATNPTALFEILSPSTEAYDRGMKALQYRLIPSVKVIGLISQNEARVELLERSKDGTWKLTDAIGMDAQMTIPALGITLLLSEIYDRVTFGDSA